MRLLLISALAIVVTACSAAAPPARRAVPLDAPSGLELVVVEAFGLE